MNKKELNKKIGQHMLVDIEVMDKVVEAVPEKHVVFEIGAGPGLLTQHLVKKSKKVLALEIDEGFKEDLALLENNNPNLEVIYGNALDYVNQKKFKEVTNNQKGIWLAGNIPYHITEPLMMNVIRLPVDGATLLTGARFANEITASLDSEHFGKLTLLVNTFFNVEIVDYVEKESFNPPPRTASAIVVLQTKPEEVIFSQPEPFIYREIFLSTSRGTLVKNILRESIIRYNDYKKTGKIKTSTKPLMTKNETRAVIRSLDIPEVLLNKSVEQLNNEEFRNLSKRLSTLNI